jgi:hypothetical protein
MTIPLSHHKQLTMHELNSCRGSRVGCEKSLQTGCDYIGTGEIGTVFELANVKCRAREEFRS